MHGVIMKNIPIVKSEGCSHGYYSNIKYASATEPGTSGWSNESGARHTYDTLRIHYKSKRTAWEDARFDLRDAYQKVMTNVKDTRFTRGKKDRALIQQNMASEDDNNFEYESRNYLQERQIDTESTPGSNDKEYFKYENSKTLPIYDNYRNIFVAGSFNIPGIILYDDWQQNTLVDIIFRIRQTLDSDALAAYYTIRRAMQTRDPSIKLSDILKFTCLAGYDVEIFDMSCSGYNCNINGLTVPMTRSYTTAQDAREESPGWVRKCIAGVCSLVVVGAVGRMAGVWGGKSRKYKKSKKSRKSRKSRRLLTSR